MGVAVTLTAQNEQVRVLVVDDSAVIRGLVSRWLASDSEIEIVATASNGAQAVERYEDKRPDVVVMDIEMPVLDGIEALQKILNLDRDAKVIMSSSLTRRNADISLRALSLGASDYLTKPTARTELHDKAGFQRDLVTKVKTLGLSRRKSITRRAPVGGVATVKKSAVPAPKPQAEVGQKQSSVVPRVLGIGSSTGGPQALFTVFRTIQNIKHIPIVITQHMPATFTTIFAEHLARASKLPCTEASDGMALENGHIYVAPGEYHMVVEEQAGAARLRLNQEPPENYCRPAVDPMFRSLAALYGPAVLGLVLTGMGQDGMNGAKDIVAKGGTILAQDEESSVVWGMPGAVANAGLCSAILPLNDIPKAVSTICAGGRL